MTVHAISNASIGPGSERPPADNPTGGVSTIPFGLFIDADTGTVYETTGEQWVQIGQLPVGASYAGVSSDEFDGLITQNRLYLNGANPDVGDYPLAVGNGVLNGLALYVDTAFGDTTVTVGNSSQPTAFEVHSTGTSDLLSEFTVVSGAGQAINVTQTGQVRALGGVGAYATDAPTTQPTMTLTTSTITDANAKAAIKALIGIINGCGIAAITEN